MRGTWSTYEKKIKFIQGVGWQPLEKRNKLRHSQIDRRIILNVSYRKKNVNYEYMEVICDRAQ
jgi:hypothetical protein